MKQINPFLTQIEQFINFKFNQQVDGKQLEAYIPKENSKIIAHSLSLLDRWITFGRRFTWHQEWSGPHPACQTGGALTRVHSRGPAGSSSRLPATKEREI